MFEMRARPELVLLQKSMVLVEGVCRALDPALDIWTVSEPVVGDWVRRMAGPLGRLEEFADQMRETGAALGRLPAILEKAEAELDAAARERQARERQPRRLMRAAAFWLFVVVAVLLIWRLIG
jgi:ubiquinone biosynthesis protein